MSSPSSPLVLLVLSLLSALLLLPLDPPASIGVAADPLELPRRNSGRQVRERELITSGKV